MKKKLVFIAPANSVHSKKWIESFLNSKFKIYWISFYKKSIDIHDDIEFHEIRSNLIFSYFKLKKLLNRINPEIVHYHYLGFQLFLIPFLKIKNLVTSPWGSDIKFSKKNTIKGFFISKIFTKSKIITVDADFMFDEVKKFEKNNLSKVNRINYGTDIKFFKFNSKIKENVFKIISLRNHEEIYDIDKLILASSILKKNNFNININIFGSGSQSDSLKNLVKKLSLEDIITFSGGYEYSKLPKLLHEYDLYISTSSSDAGLSASTSEAMSSGVSVLSADNSENSFWMNDNCGFLFKTSSVDDLVTKINEIINMNQDELDIIRSNARKKIETHNNYENEMKKMLDIYEELSL
jgi:L-malate glycosyltransferase